MNAIQIKNITDCRRLLARVINQFQKDEIKSDKAKTIAYLCNQYSHLYEVEKIEELEKKLNDFENRIG